MNTLNVSILSAEDLLRYGRPSTPLEIALFEKLQETFRGSTPWEEVAERFNCDTPDELSALIEKLQDVEPMPSDYGDLDTFFAYVKTAYDEAGSRWPGVLPGDSKFIDSVCSDIKVGLGARRLVKEFPA